ncbi:MAG: hypothetical protein NTY32_09980 [Bacteroidia bacterium]|nr:hypothetical protein [Bacteroidia bacterium]
MIIFAFDYMQRIRQNIKAGEVYRRSDLEYFSTAVDRHLSQLVKDGTLRKLSQGLYYAPKQSKFGAVPPRDNDLVERFLKNESFLLVSPNAYNGLGFGLTQLYNTTWVYNHKRRGEVKLNGKSFLFKLKSSFPASLSQEYLVVDLLNNLDELAEDNEQIVKSFQKNIDRLDANELIKMAKQYGSGNAKKLVKSALRKTHQLHA